MFAKVGGGQGSFTPLKEQPNVMNISSLAAGCSLSAALLMGCVASVQERAPCHEAAAQNETVVRQAFEQWVAEAFLDLVAYQEVIDSNEPVPTLNVPRPKEGRGQDN
jgi:hypothetical protein